MPVRRIVSPSAPVEMPLADIDIGVRLAALEATVKALLAVTPPNLMPEVAALKARVTAIESQEDGIEPHAPSEVGFSGYVYLAGKLYDLTWSTVKKWVRVTVGGTVEYTDTDPSDPFPAGEEYYRTDLVHGDIHVTRFG